MPESVEHTVTIGTVAGVRLRTTGYAWIAPLWMGLCGLGLGLALSRWTGGETFDVRYAVLVPVGAAVHTAGHLVGGALVGAPMDGLVLNSSIPFDVYPTPAGTRAVHLARALGGPILSALVGVVFLGFGGPLPTYFGALNLFIALGALVPIRDIDGSVVWRSRDHPRST